MAAGGTAGHLLPALGVAESLVRAGVPRESIGFLGSKRPLEQQVVAPYGFELDQLEVSGFFRGAWLKNISSLWKAASATFELALRIRKARPEVVIGFGGYFSFPPILAARMAGVPSVVVETNAVAGLANKISAKFATRVFASSESSGINKANLIGVPLRPEIALNDGKISEAASCFRRENDISDDALLICVFGGSLGSYTINSAVVDLAESGIAATTPPIAIYHVVGSRDFPIFAERIEALQAKKSRVRYISSEFDPEIYKAIAASDLVVSRAGSGTVAELGYFAKPSILVPLPNAPGDHQARNARKLAEVGAARVVSDSELTKERLAAEIEELVKEPAVLKKMAERSALAFDGDGSTKVAEAVLALAGRKGG